MGARVPRSKADELGTTRRLDAPGLAWIVFALVLFLAMKPGWELPGRIPREYVLIVGVIGIAILRLARGRLTSLTSPLSLLALSFVSLGAAGLRPLAHGPISPISA